MDTAQVHHLPDWFIDPLEKSLIDLISTNSKTDDRLSIIKEFEETPVRNGDKLYRGVKKSEITTKLKQLLAQDQQSLKPVDGSEAKFVPFITDDPRVYHLNSNQSTPIKELLMYYYWRVRIPPDTPCHLKVGLFGRQGKMTIKPPKDSEVICRIVMHLGPDEVYNLTEVNEAGKLGRSEKIVFPRGSYMVLDQEDLASNNIFVSPNPRVKFPLPGNCDEMIDQGLSAVGSGGKFGKGAKMPKPDQVRKMMQQAGMRKTTIRLRSYKRLTIILDFGHSSLVDDDKMFEIATFGNGGGPPPPSQNGKNSDNGESNISWPDQLPTSIPDHIIKSLPPGMDPSIISKVAKDHKLSGLVNRVARGVAADLDGRDELQSSSPKVTADLVGAIASSAMKRIDKQKVRNLSSNVESLVSGINPETINGLKLPQRAGKNARRRKARKRAKQEKRRRSQVQVAKAQQSSSQDTNSVNDLLSVDLDAPMEAPPSGKMTSTKSSGRDLSIKTDYLNDDLDGIDLDNPSVSSGNSNEKDGDINAKTLDILSRMQVNSESNSSV